MSRQNQIIPNQMTVTQNMAVDDKVHHRRHAIIIVAAEPVQSSEENGNFEVDCHSD